MKTSKEQRQTVRAWIEEDYCIPSESVRPILADAERAAVLEDGIAALITKYEAVSAESIADGKADADNSELSYGLAHREVARELAELVKP